MNREEETEARGDPGGDGVTERAEQEVREVARGRAARTPFMVIGGVATVIAVVVGILIVAAFLTWWLV